MRGKSLKLFLLLVALFALAAAGCGGGGGGSTGTSGGTPAANEGGTLVFASAADPVVLDPILVSDGESLRVTLQIFETLVDLKPGTTDLEPGLAESWEASTDGLAWTFGWFIMPLHPALGRHPAHPRRG